MSTTIGQPATKTAQTAKFISVSDFAKAHGITSMEIVKNPNTDKIFVSTNKGVFKCKQDIDTTKALVFGEFTDKTTGEISVCMLNASDSNVILTIM